MPKVGKKEFSYDKEGVAEAKVYAKKTGQNIEKGSSPMAYESNDARNRSETYQEGGKVDAEMVEPVNQNPITVEPDADIINPLTSAEPPEYKKGGKVKKKKKPDALWYEAGTPKGMKETDPRYIHTTDYIVPRSVFYGNSTEKQKRDWLKRDKKNVAGKKKK